MSPTKANRPKRRPRATTTSRPAAPTPRRDPTSPDAIVLAAIAGAHGVAGEVRLKVFANDLGAYRSFNDGALTLVGLRGEIARFAEVADRTAAEALRGTTLTVARAALPPLADGEYYHADLLGLLAATTAGKPLGTVVGIENFGAGDVIEIERPGGKRFMVPLRPEAVPEWNAERLLVDPAFVED